MTDFRFSSIGTKGRGLEFRLPILLRQAQCGHRGSYGTETDDENPGRWQHAKDSTRWGSRPPEEKSHQPGDAGGLAHWKEGQGTLHRTSTSSAASGHLGIGPGRRCSRIFRSPSLALSLCFRKHHGVLFIPACVSAVPSFKGALESWYGNQDRTRNAWSEKNWTPSSQRSTSG